LNTSKPLKVGLLGAGYICDYHARALKACPGVELVAICDQDHGRAMRAASRHRVAQVYASLDEMLAADLDAVHVLLPAERHVEAARRVLDSGRHAYVEKPMGLDAAPCRALADFAAARGRALGVSHNFLFARSYEKLRRDAADGTLGRLGAVELRWMYPFGGDAAHVFFELGVHLMAFVLDLVGPLDELRATARGRHWHVHGWKGATALDVVLSTEPGPAERSVALRGSAALAKCHFDRDLYYRHEPRGHGLGDNFAGAAGVAWQLAANAAGNLARAAAGTLRQAPGAEPFGESIARAVRRFYETLDADPDPRLSASFGAAVVGECERVTRALATAKAPAPAPAAVPPQIKPTVLVVGGSGFIGRHLVQALAAKGIGVRVSTRNARAAARALAGVAAELAQGDPADPHHIDAALEGIEAVYHLAKADDDVAVTRNIALRALAKGVGRFVYTGTIDSYYAAERGAVITDDTPLDPKIHRRNPYARAKAASEALLMELHRTQALPVVIFRPGIVIGGGAPAAHWGVGRFLSDTRLELWGEGRNPLPFVRVEDVAAALVLALDKPEIEGQSFLLTDAPLLSARDYVAAVSAACGTQLRARPTPVWQFFLGDAVRQAVKFLIRHPNRRLPSYRDWASRTQRARFEAVRAREVLGWRPAASREALCASLGKEKS
jgi:nucleoside-diphosphate-sugar epimerase/predicted dehydrogenase